MELLNQKIGSGGNAKLEFSGGKLIVSGSYDEGSLSGNLSFAVSSDVLIDELKKVIPGTLDDQMFDLLKIALKAL
jgi:hypothetical protein